MNQQTPETPQPPEQSGFVLFQVVDTIQVKGSFPAWRWRQWGEKERELKLASIHASMLHQAARTHPGCTLDFMDPVIGKPGESGSNGALLIGKDKLLQNALPVRCWALAMRPVLPEPAEQDRESFVQWTEAVAGTLQAPAEDDNPAFKAAKRLVGEMLDMLADAWAMGSRPVGGAGQ